MLQPAIQQLTFLAHSVLWHCWLDLLTRKKPVPDMTYNQGRREGGDKGVSYPGPRSVGGAPRSLRTIFLSAFTENTKADNSKFFN